MPVTWADKEQKKFLSDRMVVFIQHQADKDVASFFTSLQNQWYDLWPLEVTNAAGVSLTEKDISKVRQARNQQLRNWYNNNQRTNAAAGAGSRGFWRLNATPVKVLAPAQAYSSYHYEELIKPEVIRLWKEHLLQEDNFDYVGSTDDDEGLIPEEIDDATASIPIGFIMDVVKKMYAEASEEMKTSVELRRKEEGGPLNHVVDPVLRQEILSEVMQTIGSFDTTMTNIMHNVVRATGMNIHILLAGPVPSLGGAVSSFSYGLGATPDGTKFYNLPNFQRDVQKPFAEHAQNCFSAEVCASRALLPEAGSDDDAAPKALTNSFLKKLVKGRKQPAKNTKGARYPDIINGIRYRKSTGNSDDLENSTAGGDFPISSSSKSTAPKTPTLPASPPVLATMLPGDSSSSNVTSSKGPILSAFTPVPAATFFGDTSTFTKPPVNMAPLPPFHFDPDLSFDFQGPEFEEFIVKNLEMGTDFSMASDLGSLNTSSESDLSAFSSFSSSTSIPTTLVPTNLGHPGDASALPPTLSTAPSTPTSPALVPTVPASLMSVAVIPVAIPVPATTILPTVCKPSVPIVPAVVEPEASIIQIDTPILSANPEPILPTHKVSLPPSVLRPLSPLKPTTPASAATHNIVKKSNRRDNPIWPDWLNKAAKYLDTASASPAWNSLLEAFFEHEEALGLGVGAPYTLDWDEAPTEINWWQAEGHGDTARYPYIEPLDFGSRTQKWWLSLQPGWRGPSLSRTAPADHTWLPQYKVGGPRGLFLMIMCMSWWARNITEESTDFNKILADLTWVLKQSDSPTPGAAAIGRRSARGLQAAAKIDVIAAISVPKVKAVKRPSTTKAAAPLAKRSRRK